LLVVAVVALSLGAGRKNSHPTVTQRVNHVASQVRCPTCRELSAAESDAKAAAAIRIEIRRRVVLGQSDGEIRAFLASRYGRDILLKPPASGVAGLVWVLPVVALICGAVFLGVMFRRWKDRPALHPTDADRALVDQALRG
jgi:cytochrome c-type biogenesis protein CcmH